MKTNKEKCLSVALVKYILLFLFFSFAMESLQANTIAYYRFEEGSGNSVVDSVDNSVDGSFSGSYSNDVFANSVTNTGTSNHFSLDMPGSATALVTGEEFILHNSYADATLEFWLRAPSQSHSAIFWTKGDSSDSNRFNISINPGGNVALDYRDTSGVLHGLGGFSISVDTWTHIAVTRTVNSATSHTYQYYVDSLLVNTVTDINPNLPTATDWTISGRNGFYMDGLVDEIRFSDVALSPDEFLTAQAVVEPNIAFLFAVGLLGVMGFSHRRINMA